jgi:hypothetical protein
MAAYLFQASQLPSFVYSSGWCVDCSFFKEEGTLHCLVLNFRSWRGRCGAHTAVGACWRDHRILTGSGDIRRIGNDGRLGDSVTGWRQIGIGHWWRNINWRRIRCLFWRRRDFGHVDRVFSRARSVRVARGFQFALDACNDAAHRYQTRLENQQRRKHADRQLVRCERFVVEDRVFRTARPSIVYRKKTC